MIKRLATLSFILLISVSLAGGQNKADVKIILIPPEVEGALPSQVMMRIYIPMREGRVSNPQASGTVIFEQENQFEDSYGKIIKYKSYYILSTDHVVNQIELVLRKYREAKIRISIFGKKDTVEASIVAWEWGSTALLLRVDIPENEIDKFGFKAAKIARKLPLSLNEVKYGEPFDIVYLSGYPLGFFIANPGYISTYLYDYDFNSYTRLIKVAAIDIPGPNWRGPGQSGAGVFNQSGELVAVIIGRIPWEGALLTLAIPIDMIVERFLKQLSELKGLDLPSFELEAGIKNKPIFLGKPTETNDESNSNN